jgi:acylglycerol lipase
MRKTSFLLIAVATVLATAAVAATVATRSGARPSVGACGDPAPSGAFATYQARAADGNCLQGYAWVPDGTPVRGVLVVVHGLHDHARRYADLAQALNRSGVAVLAQDHRGHAASGGARQRIDSVEQVAGDVGLALREAALRFPGVPLFVYGHSMGGLVTAHLVADDASGSPPLAGAIVSSAALKLPASASGGQIRVVRALSALAPELPLEPIDEARVVRDPSARAALAADPLLEREKLPARTVAAVLEGIQSLQPRMASIEVPLLVLHGLADQVTEPEGSRALVAAAKAEPKVLKLYDGALHDLLHEPEGAAVRQEIVAFVDARLAAAK